MTVLIPLAVVLERVKADGTGEATESVSPAALFPSARSFATTKQQQQHQEQEHGQQELEEGTQSKITPDSFVKRVAPSCGASASFAEKSVNANTDVSCFPHDQNIGSRAHEIKVLKTDSVQGCLKECRKMSNCTHYTYNKSSKVCHLKDAVPEFYTYNGDMTGPRSCDSSCFVGCLTYSSNPIKTLAYKNTAPSLCQAACAATKDCQAFVWTQNDCKLFGRGFGAHRSLSRGDSVAGPKSSCENGADLRFREAADGSNLGTCLLSDDVASKTTHLRDPRRADNAAACQKQCVADGRCTHYTYNTRDKLCYIKAGSAHYVRAPYDVTGNRDCVPV